MSQFIQLHLLTSYAPSNLNRDDLGRPKTAKMGGFDRLRVSSQSLKRNWRVSDLFEQAMSGHTGIRTRELGTEAFNKMVDSGIKEKEAKVWASKVANVFRKDQKKDIPEMDALAFISYDEYQAILKIIDGICESKMEPSDDVFQVLAEKTSSVDVAMFGRMLTGKNTDKSIEAACQVAHALSVHSVVVEDDYFTAVDDLNDGKEDSGSAHIGESGFAAALFYSYICINKTLLIENLDGNEALANKAIQALTEAAVKVSPKGKQNSFASRAYASYVLAEKGEQQPRSLSVAFLKPVNSGDQAADAVKALTEQVENMDKVYGACAEQRYHINALTGEGTFAELSDFVSH
ncbi:type I-E CRISPR-associated protein Cas7/Cse4/CasC [Neptunicella sp.]|uniref:type I-E CRISPR-associated protein Cas7/Cse4/CasC n=1 Tax=Neptunicella sp. TaxID=2125986 RepID=UPI003F691346